MLGKLMKHEFRATRRVMLPLYLILLVTAVAANFSTRMLFDSRHWALTTLGTLLVISFGVAVAGVCVMSVLLMVQRFYKNLLQDEGYLMFTLPVSVHQHIYKLHGRIMQNIFPTVTCIKPDCLIGIFLFDFLHQASHIQSVCRMEGISA